MHAGSQVEVQECEFGGVGAQDFLLEFAHDIFQLGGCLHALVVAQELDNLILILLQPLLLALVSCLLHLSRNVLPACLRSHCPPLNCSFRAFFGRTSGESLRVSELTESYLLDWWFSVWLVPDDQRLVHPARRLLLRHFLPEHWQLLLAIPFETNDSAARERFVVAGTEGDPAPDWRAVDGGGVGLGSDVLVDIGLEHLTASIFFSGLQHNIKKNKTGTGGRVAHYCWPLQLLRMRLFVHLLNCTPRLPQEASIIKTLQRYEGEKGLRFFVEVGAVETTDAMLCYLFAATGLPEEQCIVRVVLVGNLEEKKVRLLPGHSLRSFWELLGDTESNMLRYQVELEVEVMEGASSQQGGKEGSNLGREGQLARVQAGQLRVQAGQLRAQTGQQAAEVFKFSHQLFQILLHDDLFELKSLVSVILRFKSAGVLRAIFNLYAPETGYTLLHTAIFHNKHEYLTRMLDDFGPLVNVNYRSLDGWLPFELALAIGNKRAINILLSCRRIDLNLNYPARRERVSFQLIDTINLSLMEQVIKRAPLYFEERNKEGLTAYEYLWGHRRFTEQEKTELMLLMHEKHLEYYDYYRPDLLLYLSCAACVPTASRSLSPKKEVIYNPNLKIISGEVIKCRVPPHFSKHVFLSVNCYIGAIEEYDINSKLALKTDKEKTEEYEKSRHVSMEEVESIEVMPPKEKSWYMKKEWFCFVVREKRGARTVYACLHESAANQWASEISQAAAAWNTLEHKECGPKVAKNYVHVADAEAQAHSSRRIDGRGYIDLFSKRLSLCEPMEHPLSSSMKLDEPVLKSKSHYNTLASTSMANEQSAGVSLQYRDFKMLQFLGEGQFGQVFLVECLRNGRLYALKTFSKKKIILSKQTKFVIAEVNILKQIRHPFIISLHFTFQTPSYIYLGLEYCQGRDLAKHINEELTFPEDHVRLYAAEIVLALEYVHQLGIIYRDLKPENVMLGRDGHVKLVDFGLSKKTENNFAKTFCGSPAYLSPEMLEKQGVGPETDYFSLGVVIFELIFGEPAFFSENIHTLYDNIQNGKLTFPRRINDTTRDFLEKLLQKDPRKRLGANSINDIKRHPYFAGLDWERLMRKEVAGPKRALLEDLESVESEEELVNMFHEDFDYSEDNYKINRFKNFSFVREDEFA